MSNEEYMGPLFKGEPPDDREPPEHLRFQINWVKDGFHDCMMVEGSLEECQRQGQEIVDRVKPEQFWSAQAK